jgi:hypothetical protein
MWRQSDEEPALDVKLAWKISARESSWAAAPPPEGPAAMAEPPSPVFSSALRIGGIRGPFSMSPPPPSSALSLSDRLPALAELWAIQNGTVLPEKKDQLSVMLTLPMFQQNVKLIYLYTMGIKRML